MFRERNAWRFPRHAVVTVLLLLTVQAHAAGLEDRQALCSDVSMNWADKFKCWERQAKATDESVRAAYEALLKDISSRPGQAKALTAAQDAWISFREATSQYYSAAISCNTNEYCLDSNVIYFSTYSSISQDRLSELRAARSQKAAQGLLF